MSEGRRQSKRSLCCCCNKPCAVIVEHVPRYLCLLLTEVCKELTAKSISRENFCDSLKICGNHKSFSRLTFVVYGIIITRYALGAHITRLIN